MKSTFTIDQDGITILLEVESKYERAVARMLKDFEVMSVNVVDKSSPYYNSDPEVECVRFRMARRDS